MPVTPGTETAFLKFNFPQRLANDLRIHKWHHTIDVYDDHALVDPRVAAIPTPFSMFIVSVRSSISV